MLLKVKKNPLAAGAIFITAALIVLMSVFTLITRYSQGNDSAKEHDIYVINTAIEKQLQTADELEGSPPASLASVHITGLQGRLTDYTYKPDIKTQQQIDTATEEFGFSYIICTTFHRKGAGDQSAITGSFTTGGEPTDYQAHPAGYTCYQNDIYKGGSHISLLTK